MRGVQTWGLTFLLCGLGAAAEARTGVVFVHGKGGADLANEAVARAYWTEPMIRATTKGYAIPHLVCHYDGTQYMWVAAGQVAGQIHDRSEERRVGKECRSRWSRDHQQNK